MRWKESRPVAGDTRVKKVYLVFPKCINNEWRWLETAWIKQRFIVRSTAISGWEDVCWLPVLWRGDPDI